MSWLWVCIFALWVNILLYGLYVELLKMHNLLHKQCDIDRWSSLWSHEPAFSIHSFIKSFDLSLIITDNITWLSIKPHVSKSLFSSFLGILWTLYVNARMRPRIQLHMDILAICCCQFVFDINLHDHYPLYRLCIVSSWIGQTASNASLFDLPYILSLQPFQMIQLSHFQFFEKTLQGI